MNSHSWSEALRQQERLPRDYAAAVLDCIEPLAGKVAALLQRRAGPVIVGVAGAQGSGKSTLALFLQNWLRFETGTSAVTLGLDDLYLGRREREVLARAVHPLLRTRGVPGTHDVELGQRLLKDLTGTHGSIRLPVFDKAADDCVIPSPRTLLDTPVDVVLFEGWCVGARPQPEDALDEPVNELEAEHDANGSWRRYVNHRLRTDYAQLFDCLDALVFLRVPSFDKVLEWRRLQEEKLRGRADIDDIRIFVSHFERLTRHIQVDLPRFANTVIGIDNCHRMAAMTHRGW